MFEGSLSSGLHVRRQSGEERRSDKSIAQTVALSFGIEHVPYGTVDGLVCGHSKDLNVTHNGSKDLVNDSHHRILLLMSGDADSLPGMMLQEIGLDWLMLFERHIRRFSEK